MQGENLSLQSLARSTRGVGVTDLREALEGRSGKSSPALTKPASISTLERGSFMMGADTISSGLALTPSRSSRKRAIASGNGEVRDVLNKLGIGKENGSSLLKASFPSLQKGNGRYVGSLQLFTISNGSRDTSAVQQLQRHPILHRPQHRTVCRTSHAYFVLDTCP
jgi:hypothetical protein